MKKWFNYVIAICTATMVYHFTKSSHATFFAAGTLLLILGVIFSFDQFRSRLNTESLIFSLVGFFLAFAALGMGFPFLNQLPSYVYWPVLGIFTSVSTYSFYLYQEEKRLGGSVLNKKGAVDKTGDTASETNAELEGERPKVLDTSIVIDGRIIDIVETGFVAGPFVVPNFVLREIQLISDSADSIKRSRGRRGLDMLNEFQRKWGSQVVISYTDYTDTREVDAKLIRITKELGGKLLTNDFNLHKVAGLQGVPVLNINNLINSLKPIVLPGEEMDIQVVKEGKDENQGIGYLDDGTMVVVENGRHLLNKKIRVVVTSMIQTNAGKMIFTKPEKHLARSS